MAKKGFRNLTVSQIPSIILNERAGQRNWEDVERSPQSCPLEHYTSPPALGRARFWPCSRRSGLLATLHSAAAGFTSFRPFIMQGKGVSYAAASRCGHERPSAPPQDQFSQRHDFGLAARQPRTRLLCARSWFGRDVHSYFRSSPTRNVHPAAAGCTRGRSAGARGCAEDGFQTRNAREVRRDATGRSRKIHAVDQ
jgi:hypothetical protein